LKQFSGTTIVSVRRDRHVVIGGDGQVTLGNTKEIARAHEVVAMSIEFMLDLDLTGYLRNKFDQAKKNFRRLEEMSYDLAIREK